MEINGPPIHCEVIEKGNVIHGCRVVVLIGNTKGTRDRMCRKCRRRFHGPRCNFVRYQTYGK